MRAWPAPEVPSPSGAGPALRLHDTATGELRETAPGPVARMYVCGITPYDATHLGHAATYVAFDLVGRVWRDLGHRVHYVQNVTDVDDPLLERAARDGEDWRALAERETDTFRADMTALRVLPPDDFVGAAETVPEMVAAVQGLQGRGATYDVDGDTYFAVHADRRFGAVAGLDEASMVELFAEGGGDRTAPARSTRSTLFSGRPAGRPSRRGTHRWDVAARAGTSSAPRSRWTGSGAASTSRVAAATWPSRTTR